MRIVMINFWGKGGMLFYTSQLANELARCPDMDINIFVSDVAASIAGELIDKAVNIHYCKVITEQTFEQFARLPFYFLQLPSIYSRILNLKPDIVHTVSAHIWMIFLLPLIARKVPIVSTIHDVNPHPGLDNTLRKRVEIDTSIINSRAVFVHGRALKERLIQKSPSFNPKNVVIIPHGDYSFFRKWSHGLEEEKGTILFFGRIREYKGLPQLVEAYLQVKKVIRDAKLIIAGDGPLEKIASGVNNLPDSEIHNHYISEIEVCDFFERASVIVCPYTEASQSGVVPVAYAFKKPVIVTNVGSISEAVDDGKTGLVIPPGNSASLADAIIKLLKDDKLRKKMGQNGFLKMERELNWGEIAEKTINVYQKVIDGYPVD